MSKIDHSLFRANEHALHEAYGLCPECANPLHMKHSKSGPFIGCSAYPQCQFTKPLHEYENTELKVIEGSNCPHCQSKLAIKKGRYGLYIGCTTFPECHHIEPIKQKNDTHVACPQCKDGQLLQRTNKYGKSFYSCSAYPDCKYVLNQLPVDQACPECNWPVMVDKKTYLQCPQKSCLHKLNKD